LCVSAGPNTSCAHSRCSATIIVTYLFSIIHSARILHPIVTYIEHWFYSLLYRLFEDNHLFFFILNEVFSYKSRPVIRVLNPMFVTMRTRTYYRRPERNNICAKACSRAFTARDAKAVGSREPGFCKAWLWTWVYAYCLFLGSFVSPLPWFKAQTCVYLFDERECPWIRCRAFHRLLSWNVTKHGCD